jgi:hypothetical protein
MFGERQAANPSPSGRLPQADPRVFWSQPLEFFNEFSFARRQVARNDDFNPDIQIPAPTGAFWHSQTCKSQQLPALCSGRHSDFDATVQSRNFNFSAEGSLSEGDGNFTVKVVAFPLKERMLANSDG